MRIIVSQNDKRLDIEFHQGKFVDKFVIGKADDFLGALDRFIRKRRIRIESLQKAGLKFVNVGVLTERVIRAIISGLRF